MPRLLIFSDLHNDTRALEKLMNVDADYYFCAGDLVTFRRGLDKMAEGLKMRAERMYVIPGNHESESDVEAMCKRCGFVNFHGATMNIGGVHVAGLGYSSPTPFNTPGEYSEEELASRLSKFADLNPLVLICHAPPLNSKLDRIREELHAGSSAVREFIEKHQPRDFFCGHIHEAEGVVEKFGSTRAQNVGKRGYLLEL
ncbi:MAG TPA: metallophosphoesterase [Bryobacteraceae bacterium]|nr:metallophosphoesterase [Bryobacteraceae bacterium]